MPDDIAVPTQPLSATGTPERGGYRLANPIRFVTAASLFDGHDASINIIRRLLQSGGAEVVHLGHNRSVDEVVRAALQEDVQGIAISSYQGGHMEYFKYMLDLLREQGGGEIRVFGGGGGVIVAEEVAELHAYGVARIYTPEDGRRLGLQGMIDDMLARADFDPAKDAPEDIGGLSTGDARVLARIITALEAGVLDDHRRDDIHAHAHRRGAIPVLGVTGTGGAGKSSLTDELVRRFRMYSSEPRIAVIAIDPTRRKTGGALLGDRIRMNAIDAPNVFMRSIATRSSDQEIPQALPDIVAATKAAGFDLVIVETPGIGQGDAGIAPHVDVALYVMTPEFGAASQLEKIDMLDFADVVAVNKFDRQGALDALARRRQADPAQPRGVHHSRWTRCRCSAPSPRASTTRASAPSTEPWSRCSTSAASGNGAATWPACRPASPTPAPASSRRRSGATSPRSPTPSAATTETVAEQVRIARERQHLRETRRMLADAGTAEPEALAELVEARERALDPRCRKLIELWPTVRETYGRDEFVVRMRDKEVRTKLYQTTLSGSRIPKVALPAYEDEGEILKWLLKENVPGSFPFTAGVFSFKREGEDPTRMFAGEGDPFRTNARFKLLSKDSEAKRLSTAFDSVTLYGFDPNLRPDIYGKIGNAGVSIATLDDIKALYDGFALCDPRTSVSMTINGPAPTILAMFFNAAIDQQLDRFVAENGRRPTEDEADKIRDWVLENVRGTVQADILKEDQGQNTCIFSTEFALRMMADIQDFFVHHRVRNFYSVSISGYHIAEAGANPITQLAFTLANGFTYVEAYLARGMHIDDFGPNLSFFFSAGMDPEYTVMGRVARRIWATAMRFKYGASERSQKLKYHTQTSGRSLHAQEYSFNDIRTTLQALLAIYDNTNSLHTNAYDEAITTPTAESVRRAMAIQLIINREWGLAKNENPNQGSFIIDELTDLVEAAVLEEFNRISERGGVLGAMETGYQRAKIQEESLYYERKKHDGSYPIIGVNTFLNPCGEEVPTPELVRSTEAEKQSQIQRLEALKARNADAAPEMVKRLQQAATAGDNVFAVLMDAVRVLSLGQITAALFEVGGQYRRSM